MPKKLGIILVSFVLIISMYGKKNQYTINGNVEGFADSTKLYLEDMDARKIVDSTMIMDNSFTFVGKVEHKKPHMIYQKGNMRKRVLVWVENSKITIDGTEQNFRNAGITGSKVQEQKDSLQKQLGSLPKKCSVLGKKRKKLENKDNVPKDKLQSIRQKHDSVVKAKTRINKNYIESNPGKFYSGFRLRLLMKYLDNNEVDSLYNLLSSDVKSSAYGKKVKRYLKLCKEMEKGDQAADFTIPTAEGDSIKLSDYRGEYVLLNFWVSAYPPCRKLNKKFLNSYNKYRDKDFNILSVSIDQNREDWIQAIKQDGMIWDNASNLNGYDGKVALIYDISTVPTNYLINPEGKIIAAEIEKEQLDQKLEEIFDEKR